MEEKLVYKVGHDGPAMRRATKAFLRYDWFRWVRSLTLCSLAAASILIFCFSTAYRAAQRSGFQTGLIVAACLGVGFVLVYFVVHFLYSLERSVEGHGVEEYTCELNDERFVVTDADGCQSGIPWSVLKIVRTTPDAYCVMFNHHSLLVFRKPLQEAGFEAEFVRRASTPSVDRNDPIPPIR